MAGYTALSWYGNNALSQGSPNPFGGNWDWKDEELQFNTVMAAINIGMNIYGGVSAHMAAQGSINVLASNADATDYLTQDQYQQLLRTKSSSDFQRFVFDPSDITADMSNVGLAIGSLGMAGRNIVDQGGVNIRHFGTGADHGPAHAHVTGQGSTTRIGPQGFPLKGDPPLSAAQRAVVQKNLKIIQKTLNKLGRAFQAIDRATPKMILTPLITEEQLYNIQQNLPLDMESQL